MDTPFKTQPTRKSTIGAILDVIDKTPKLVDKNILDELFAFCNSAYGRKNVDKALLLISKHAFIRAGKPGNGTVKLYFEYKKPQSALVAMLLSDDHARRMSALSSLEKSARSKDFPETLDKETVEALIAVYNRKDADVRTKGIVMVILIKGKQWELGRPVAIDALKGAKKLHHFAEMILNGAKRETGQNKSKKKPHKANKTLLDRLNSTDYSVCRSALSELDHKYKSKGFRKLVNTDVARAVARAYWHKDANKKVRATVLHILLKAKQYKIGRPVALDANKNHKELSFLADRILKAQ